MAIPNTSYTIHNLDTIFNKSSKIFIIGIGGVSLSSIAKYCVSMGKTVFGCDAKRTPLCSELEKICHIKYYSSTDSVRGMDLVIYTTAIDESNFEYRRARELNIPLVSRANFLGYIMSKYKNRIGICGMHGKSTVTSMLSHIYMCAGKSPTAFCGAEMTNYNSCAVFGGWEHFIFEACEYYNAFHSFLPTECAITNIDFDHPDFFKSTEEIICSFQKFASMADRVYINSDNALSKKIKHKSIITYGIREKADYMAKITHSKGKNEFFVLKKGRMLGKCTLGLLGEHFVSDALCAFAIAYENNIPACVIENAFDSFSGTRRRMELIKKTDTGTDIFEDYAHHPTEIKASLASLRAMGYKRVLCIFQAHTYSRTFMLFDEFKTAFIDTDSLIITPIYPARETNTFDLTDRDFALACGGAFMDDYEKIAEHVSKFSYDAIIVMGAGDLQSRLKL